MVSGRGVAVVVDCQAAASAGIVFDVPCVTAMTSAGPGCGLHVDGESAASDSSRYVPPSIRRQSGW